MITKRKEYVIRSEAYIEWSTTRKGGVVIITDAKGYTWSVPEYIYDLAWNQMYMKYCSSDLIKQQSADELRQAIREAIEIQSEKPKLIEVTKEYYFTPLKLRTSHLAFDKIFNTVVQDLALSILEAVSSNDPERWVKVQLSLFMEGRDDEVMKDGN